jgi:hypothetical protein
VTDIFLLLEDAGKGTWKLVASAKASGEIGVCALMEQLTGAQTYVGFRLHITAQNSSAFKFST